MRSTTRSSMGNCWNSACEAGALGKGARAALVPRLVALSFALLQHALASPPPALPDVAWPRRLQYQKLLQDTRDMVKQRPRPGENDSPEQLRNTLEGRKVPEGLLRCVQTLGGRALPP